MIAIEYHADLKEVQGDAVLCALLAAQNVPFDRLEWWQGLAEHCGLTPLIAVARGGDDVALLPLQAGNGHLHALANWYNFTARPLASPGADVVRLFTALAADLKRKASRITLYPVPDEAAEASTLVASFTAAGWRLHCELADTNHVLEVAGQSYAEYLAARPGHLRTTLKRRAGKLDCRIATGFGEQEWADYNEVYHASWKPEEGSSAFLEAFARAEGAAGRLRLGIARADGRPVAAQLWSVEGGIAYIHKLAYAEDAKALSPGSVLSAAMFEHIIDRDGVQMIDFGTGDDPYKRDWMEQQRPRYRLDMFNPANPRCWAALAKAELRRLAGRRSDG